jgi:hypothetical protein
MLGQGAAPPPKAPEASLRDIPRQKPLVVPDPKDGAKEIKTSIDFDSARVGQKITLVGDLTKDKAGRMMIVTSVKRMGEEFHSADIVQANCAVAYTENYGARVRVVATVTEKGWMDPKYHNIGYLMLDDCAFSRQ